MAGPLGRPFEVDPRSRHLLLVAAGLGIASVRMLIDEAIRDGRRVTLLFGAASAREVYPSSLLPDEVEYIVATDDGSLGHHGTVIDLVGEYEAWADQAFASGPAEILGALAHLAAGRRGRLGVAKLGRKRGAGRVDPAGSTAARRKAFLQVSMEAGDVRLRRSKGASSRVVLGTGAVPLRVCREGPVFAAEQIARGTKFMEWRPGPPVRPYRSVWTRLVGSKKKRHSLRRSVVTTSLAAGSKGEPYSPLNHYVSELGELGVSNLAALFNLSLEIGGVCFVLFMIGLAVTRTGWLRVVYGATGVIAGIGGALVGVFPMNDLDKHRPVALTFFLLGLVTVLLASIDLVRAPDPRFPRWLAAVGGAAVVAFAVFLAILFGPSGGLTSPEVRPAISPLTIFEWLLIVGILAWVFLTAFAWRQATR